MAKSDNTAYRLTGELFLRLRVGLLAGLAAGALVGMAEGLWLLIFNWGSINPGVLLYGAVLYSLIGAGMGLGLGLVLGILSMVLKKTGEAAGIYGLIFAVVFALNGLVIFRFRIFRDVMHEQPIPLLINLALLAVFVLLFLVFAFVLRLLVKNTPLKGLAKVVGTLLIVGSFFFVLFLVQLAGTYVHRVKGPALISAPGEEKAVQGPSVLLLMIDTLRADRLSCYGYEGNETPVIDGLAGDGILFQNQIAQSSWTRPAVASILTSLYPSSHKTYLKPDMLPDEVVTLPEALKEQGYRTIGFADNINVTEAFNFQQGFDRFVYLAPDYFFLADESSSQLAYYSVLRLIRERFLSRKKYVQHYYQDADVVNQSVIQALEGLDSSSPAFIFAHYMDPHDPYFTHPYDGYGVARVSMPHPPAEMAEELSQLYDGEVSFLDERLGQLFDRMRELGIYDDWTIVLTADHGEEFYEHQGWWHGLTLYQEQVNVPLIIKLPGSQFAGLRVPGLVRQIDICPTVLALAGGSHDDFQGIDLMPAVAGLVTPPVVEGEGEAEEVPQGGTDNVVWQLDSVFSEEDHEGNVIHALIAGKWKLIRANEGNPRGLPVLALYNLEDDPGETTNLADGNTELVAELDRQLEERLTVALESAVQRVEGDEMDEATRSRLEALGYLEE